MMQLDWQKCEKDHWCLLYAIDPAQERFNVLAVYIIWHGGSHPATLFVGYGNIRDAITAYREDPRIIEITEFHFYITWAEVFSPEVSGVVKYLNEQLYPKYRILDPLAYSIKVNLPW